MEMSSFASDDLFHVSKDHEKSYKGKYSFYT